MSARSVGKLCILALAILLLDLCPGATATSPAGGPTEYLAKRVGPADTRPRLPAAASNGRDRGPEVWLYEPGPKERRKGQRWRTLFFERPGGGTLVRANYERRGSKDLAIEVSRGPPPAGKVWKALMGTVVHDKVEHFVAEAHLFGLAHANPVEWMDAFLEHVWQHGLFLPHPDYTRGTRWERWRARQDGGDGRVSPKRKSASSEFRSGLQVSQLSPSRSARTSQGTPDGFSSSESSRSAAKLEHGEGAAPESTPPPVHASPYSAELREAEGGGPGPIRTPDRATLDAGSDQPLPPLSSLGTSSRSRLKRTRPPHRTW